MIVSRSNCRAALGLALALGLGLPVAAWAQIGQTVRIGHAGPLTGGAAHWGRDNDNGARLAVEDLNQQQLLIGGKRTRFVLQSEDDQADPKQAMVVANKLADMGVKGVLGHFNSGAAIPASAVYHRAGLPMVSTATNPGLTRQGYDNVFRILASDEDVGMALAHYAVRELKAKKVALIDDRTAYGQGAAEVFARGVKGLGGVVVAQEFGSDKASDFTAILTRIKGRQPDVLFYGGMDAQGGLIARQMKQLGISAKLLGTDGLCTDEIARISAGAVDDVLYCTRGGKEIDGRPRGAEFAQRYKARFGVDALTYAPYLYDAMMALAAGMRAADSVDPAAYLPAMRKIHFDGVTGAISFDAQGNLQQPDFTVFGYQDGKRVRVAGS